MGWDPENSMSAMSALGSSWSKDAFSQAESLGAMKREVAEVETVLRAVPALSLG